jgi:hypothetical protein
MKSENLKVIKPQITLSTNVDRELSKIDYNLNKLDTKGRLLGVFILANFPTLTKVNLIITDTQRNFEIRESIE